jgi:hypothetical protein
VARGKVLRACPRFARMGVSTLRGSPEMFAFLAWSDLRLPARAETEREVKDGGINDLENLITLCGHHHRQWHASQNKHRKE